METGRQQDAFKPRTAPNQVITPNITMALKLTSPPPKYTHTVMTAKEFNFNTTLSHIVIVRLL